MVGFGVFDAGQDQRSTQPSVEVYMIAQCYLYSYALSTMYVWGRWMHRNIKSPQCSTPRRLWYNNTFAFHKLVHLPFGAKKALIPSGFGFFLTLAASAFLGVGPPSCSSRAK